MAILIIIQKIEDNEKKAIYEYGFGTKSQGEVNIKEVKGKVAIDKLSGNIKLIKICGDGENKNDFFLDRVNKVLKMHHQSHEYPESTYYMV